MAKLSWKPWHEVVTLREDVRSGELPLHLFAADLYEVIMQRGRRPVYEKPEEFFALTFPTFSLRKLVRDVVLRLAGKNDKAVRQLELTYGGGKTHTLITLRHLVSDPSSLPDLPSVAEFIQAIGETPPQCRVAGLCFDKLDVEKGMEVRAPDGSIRVLRQPWSVLAYQLAGDAGLRLLHADGQAAERDSAPAENLVAELLAIPGQEGLGTLVLIDEVLMYAREKAGSDPESRSRLANFFQYLTQAAVGVDRCCVVASLLATDPRKSDHLGREIQAELYDIFQREREEAVEPVVQEDVAEVLRRRFFTPESLRDRERFRQHVSAALKGIAGIDEQTARQGADAEERFLKSYPFHPDLTEVLYGKWTQLARFQRTRGVLRTFALALREAAAWDASPLIGPAAFLSPPGVDGLSEALREMVAVADTEEWEGKKPAWTGIVQTEVSTAKSIQEESVALRWREIEQAVIATFLHSQPVGQSAKTRDLAVLIASGRPDKIELEKGLARWAQTSYWLDDQYATPADGQLPGTWRLGNRPNLTQMHAAAARNIGDDTVRSRLLDEIGKVKALTANASGAGVKVHTLPARPKDVEDDGAFHYAVLGPQAASDSGKPSAEARRFLDETTGAERPRVYRNAMLLLVPGRDGLDVASARIRDYLAWEIVREEIKRQQREGGVDPARAQTLQINVDKARGQISDAIRHAYCIVVTVSEKNEPQAFKITVSDEVHFVTIKNDRRSRVQDTAVTAEALLPEGPYNLWRSGETSRRVRDLSGAFAQLPHLPKMLTAGAIVRTLADGCQKGTFVLRLTRPDGTSRAWWMRRPDDATLSDPSLELVLPQAAELSELPPELLAPGALPGLWGSEGITVSDVLAYFGGTTSVQVDRGGYREPFRVPGADPQAVYTSTAQAIERGILWLLSGPASISAEPVPAGILTPSAGLRWPPSPIPAPSILPMNLPGAWNDDVASALSIATALSVAAGVTLPWRTVRDAISGALQARFLQLAEGSHGWPCDLPSAQLVRLTAKAAPGVQGVGGLQGVADAPSKFLIARAQLEPAQVQELGEVVPKLLEVRASTGVPLRFHVEVRLGDGKDSPPDDVAMAVDAILRDVSGDLELRHP